MRGVLACVVLAVFLLPGCTTTDIDPAFLALAARAPDLLATDMGPTGSLNEIQGTMSMTMTMNMKGQDMTLGMNMDMAQKFLQQGSYLMTMQMKDMVLNDQSTPMHMTLTFFCSPDVLVFSTAGMPDGKDLSKRLANPMHACKSGAGGLSDLSSDVDAQTLSTFQSMMKQSAVPNLKFSHAQREAGKDYAIYDSTLDFGAAGMDVNFRMQTRATLSGEHIAYLDLTGSGDVTIPVPNQSTTAHINMTGHMVFSYGARSLVPAAYS